MDIQYDRYSLIIDGKREFIRSGAMHYFRLPSQELWRDRLFKLKAAGYNCVDLYFCWNYHSPEQGVYDFTGIRDVRKLLQITQELGLYVIARPGPYINAEYSGGGFPGWMLAKKDLPLRNRREGAFEWSDEYMGYVKEWWEQIIPILNEAPNIILMQIENEYATLEAEPDYMQALYKMTREMGVKVPLFHNDLFVAGLYEDIVDIYSFDNYSVTQFETDWREMPEIFQVLDNVEASLRPFCQNRPLMAAELQAGWYGTWKGYRYEKITELLGREHINISTKSLLGQGLTIYNHYKGIGGTNWDYTGSIETYTSYDFGAPISEAGVNTERLFEAKALNWFLQSFDLIATDREKEFPLALGCHECLYAVRALKDHPEAKWLWLRNLTYDEKFLTVENQYPITVRPFEAIILPYRMPLKCGYSLAFSSTEALYQNEKILVLKANRPVMATIQTKDSSPLFDTAQATDVTLVDSDLGGVTFQCAPLGERELRRVTVGELNVILLGQQLIDTFWVQEDGTMVCGPEMRLPEGEYGLAEGSLNIFVISRDGASVMPCRLPQSEHVEIPKLSEWQIFDEAPELTRDGNPAFRPVAELPDFDANGIYEGSAWYRVPLGEFKPGKKPAEIKVDARHIWAAFLNGKYIGEGHQLMLIHGLEPPPPTAVKLPDKIWLPDAENELLIFVSGLGHPKGFHDDAQTPQGLLTLTVDGQDRTRTVEILPEFYSRRPEKAELNGRLTAFEESPIVRLKTEFTLPDVNAAIPWGLQLQDMDFERINIYLNGCLIGRYWRDCQCQDVFYLPTGILKTDPKELNTLELILMNFKPFIDRSELRLAPDQVRLYPYGVFTKWQLPATLKAS